MSTFQPSIQGDALAATFAAIRSKSACVCKRPGCTNPLPPSAASASSCAASSPGDDPSDEPSASDDPSDEPSTSDVPPSGPPSDGEGLAPCEPAPDPPPPPPHATPARPTKFDKRNCRR